MLEGFKIGITFFKAAQCLSDFEEVSGGGKNIESEFILAGDGGFKDNGEALKDSLDIRLCDEIVLGSDIGI